MPSTCSRSRRIPWASASGRGGHPGTWTETGRNGRDNHVTELGARVPVGMELGFTTMKPLEFFFEVAPGLVLVDSPGVSVDANLGARWFF